MAAPRPPSSASGLSDDWVLYFNQLSAYLSRSGTTTDVSTAQTSATAAQTSATAAQTSADTALAEIAALNALWLVGDYKASARTLGTGWLECDGSEFDTAAYPALAAVLLGITGSHLPSVPAIFDVSHPSPDGPAVLRWFIRAS